ncbi:MAG: hypothetical protein R2755_05510 [Acidimicrobiales bacterium]
MLGAVAAHVLLIATARRPRRAWRTVGLHTMLIGMAGVAVRPLAAGRLPLGDPHSGGGRALRATFEQATAGWTTAALGVAAAGVLIVAATPLPARHTRRHRWRSRVQGAPARLVPAARARLAAAPPPARAVVAATALAGVVLAARSAERIATAAVAVALGAALWAFARAVARSLPQGSPGGGERRCDRRCDRRCGWGWSTDRVARRAGRAGPVDGCATGVGQLAAALSCLGAMLWWDVAGAPAPRAAGPQRCNGHVELCDRPLDEVTFAGSHNAMASVDAGFLFAQQRLTIGEQLDRGVRALLVDTKYGLRTTTSGVVWTEFRRAELTRLERELGADVVASMQRLRPSLVRTSEQAEVFLCHGYCELGATPASEGFGQLREFLERNPDEVVLLYVQDSTEPGDTVRALDDAGLARYAYAHPDGAPWPTLGSMISAGTRLVVLAEQHGGTEGTPAWFQRAFALTQDTPYDAARPEQLSCAANRGPADAPLFLLNHWLAAGRRWRTRPGC